MIDLKTALSVLYIFIETLHRYLVVTSDDEDRAPFTHHLSDVLKSILGISNEFVLEIIDGEGVELDVAGILSHNY